MIGGDTWAAKQELSSETVAGIIAKLKDSGLPLNYQAASDDSQALETAIVVFASVTASGEIKGRFLLPSGAGYDVQSSEFVFWNFIFRNHYVVTGNGFDRRFIAEFYSEDKPDPKDIEDPLKPKRPLFQHQEMTGFCAPFDYTKMNGRAVSKVKSDQLSGMSVEQMIAALGKNEIESRPRQRMFF